jgi:hypothetical protein
MREMKFSRRTSVRRSRTRRQKRDARVGHAPAAAAPLPPPATPEAVAHTPGEALCYLQDRERGICSNRLQNRCTLRSRRLDIASKSKTLLSLVRLNYLKILQQQQHLMFVCNSRAIADSTYWQRLLFFWSLHFESTCARRPPPRETY